MLDKSSPIPLYHQLKTLIEEKIASGEWKPGSRIPSERELCEQSNVSRLTVRQALAELVNAGRLVRDQGRGTFVAMPRVEQRLNQLNSFTHELQARGLKPGARILRLECVTASTAAAHALQLEPSEQVIVLKRLRLANDEPLAIETACLPACLCRSLLEEDLQDRSLYHVLFTRFGLSLAWAEQRVEALACPPAVAELLGIGKGMPVMHTTRTTHSHDGTPFEYTEAYYRGDKHFFNVKLRNDR